MPHPSLPPPKLACLTIIYTIPPTPYGGMFDPYSKDMVEYYAGDNDSAQAALRLWKQDNKDKNVHKTFGWPDD